MDCNIELIVGQSTMKFPHTTKNPPGSLSGTWFSPKPNAQVPELDETVFNRGTRHAFRMP